MPPLPLRCPSCDHGNPVGANFCNNCGTPVHFETCAHCEAINHRNAERCHKCGSRLSLSPEFEPEPEEVLTDTMASSLDGWPIVDSGTPIRESRIHARDAAVDGGGANVSGGAEHRVGTDELLMAASRQPVQQDVVAAAARSDPEPTQVAVAQRRPLGMRASVAAVTLVAFAILAYQEPAWFREGLEAITPRFDGPSDVQSIASPQLIPIDGPASQQRETAAAPSSPQDAAQNARGPSVDATSESGSPRLDATPQSQSPPGDTAGATQSPPLDATRDSQSQLANEPQSTPPKAAGGTKLSSSDTHATSRPQSAKDVRQPPARSGASGSKQGNASRKVASTKAPDVPARAKGSGPRRSQSKEQAGDSGRSTAPLDIPMVAE